MVRESFLSLIRKAAKMFCCGCQPRLSGYPEIWRDEPQSPSSTRAVHGSPLARSRRQSFYFHRNCSSALIEHTPPTTDSPSNDQKVVQNIGEWLDSVESAKQFPESDKMGLQEELCRSSGIGRDLENRLNRWAQQEHMNWPQAEQGYTKDILATDIRTSQAAEEYLKVMSQDVNTSFRQWKDKTIHHQRRHLDPTYELGHENYPSLREELPARQPRAQSQQRIGRPAQQLELLPSSCEEIHANDTTGPPTWQYAQDIFWGALADWMGMLSLKEVRQFAAQWLSRCF